MELNIHWLRKGSFFPSDLERMRRIDQAPFEETLVFRTRPLSHLGFSYLLCDAT